MRGALVGVCTVLAVATTSAGQEFQSSSPPFRVRLLSVHRQRDVMLVRGAWIWVDEQGSQRPIENRTPRSRSAGGPDFYARLRISTDPPTWFRQAGAPRLDQAVDDLGQTLEPFDDAAEDVKPKGSPQRALYVARDVRLPLSLPEQPGKTIKHLKGFLPVALSVRSAEPITTVDITTAKGRTVRAGDAQISLLDVRIEPDGTASVKLSAKLESEKGESRDRESQERMAAQLVDVVQRQIDLVDDQSRVVTSYATTNVRRNEIRATLSMRPGEGYGPPDRLRVWGLARSVQQIPFEFQNVPLP